MKKLFIALLLTKMLCANAAGDGMVVVDAGVSGGKLYEYKNFPTSLIQARNVYVWVPENYSSQKRYDVVYMHDGQMLFDAETTWNHQEWKVDENVSALMAEGKIRDCIVVGVWNIAESRFHDYFPQKTLNYMSEAEFCEFDKELDASRMNADSYLKFIVNELKPYIDKNFSTNKGREHTFLMGSSMGGLISLYGLCEYPDVFGGAACLSMHTLMVTSKLMNIRNTEIAAPAFCRYLEEKLLEANRSKIYIDYGDKTLDSYYAPYQQKIDDVLRRKGWHVPYWTTNYYAGMAHTETDWAKRLFIPFMFLLEKE